MVSGYFIRADEDDVQFIKQKAKSLLYPYGIACQVRVDEEILSGKSGQI